MPRRRGYRNHKRMRQRLRAETECFTLLNRRRAMISKRVNRQIDLNDPAMMDVLQRQAQQKFEEELDKLEYEVASFQMRKIARDGNLSHLHRRLREEQEGRDAAFDVLRGRA